MAGTFNFNLPPFDKLSPDEAERLSAATDLAYFVAGTNIQHSGDTICALRVVMKGLVCEVSDTGDTEYHGEGEVLDSKSLLSGKASCSLQAEEDTLIWHIHRDIAIKIAERNTPFSAFFYADVARKLSLLHQPVLPGNASKRVADADRHQPCWLDATASVLDAAQLMKAAHTRAVLVDDAGSTGIFTQSDLRNFVAAGLNAQDENIRQFLNRTLVSVGLDDDLNQAMLLMVRHGVQRLIVRDANGQICSLLEQIDLMSAMANNPRNVTAQIGRAQNMADLVRVTASTRQLIQQLCNSGMKIPLLAEMVSEIRNRLFARLFALLAPTEITAHVCLLVLGSEGRGEQILNTDQDNALIIEDGFEHPALTDFCTAFTHSLIELGYPPCPGGVMISNPAWRQSAEGFARLQREWLRTASGEHVMNLAIWLDAVPVAGNPALFDPLREKLFAVERDGALLSRFAFPIEQFATPLRLFARLRTTSDSRLDLKKGGIFPLVHGLRSLALESGITERNSYRRLDELVRLGVLPASDGQDLAESLAFLQGLQLRHGLDALQRGKPADNFIDPERLAKLDKELLKDTLAVVKHFRQLLNHHFRLNQL